MGYRSEVCVAIYGEELTLKQFRAFFNEKFEEYSTADGFVEDYEYLMKQSESITNKPLFNDDNEFFFFAESIKWYGEYKFVEFMYELMNKAADMNLVMEFIRIGEDYEDTETDYSWSSIPCEYRLGVHRTIDFNF